MTTDIVPRDEEERITGKNLPGGFPEETVKMALVLMEDSRSVAHAERRLRKYLEPRGEVVPDYCTLWQWARDRESVISGIRGDKKRDMVAMCDDVAQITTERLLQAIPNLSDSQLAVPWGIAMQRRTDWENAGDKAPTTAIQIILTDSKGQSIPEV